MLNKGYKRKIFILHNGCDRRGLDASRMHRYFKLNNCQIVNNPRRAEHIILVTCSFIKFREDHSLALIRKFKRYKKSLIVAGCLPVIAPDKLNKEFNGEVIVTKNIEEIDKVFEGFSLKFKDVPDANSVQRTAIRDHFIDITIFLTYLRSSILRFLNLFDFSKRFYRGCLARLRISVLKRFGIDMEERFFDNYLRISNGCLSNCSYCGIRNAVGSLVSKAEDVILSEYRKLLSENKKNFSLVGEDVGAYGMDSNSSLPKLFERLSEADRSLDVRWDIHHLNPLWSIKYKSELVKLIRSDKIARVLCPIQSGSDRILRLMHRYSDTENIIRTLLEFKEANHKLILDTQVIVGFPSETHEEFLATVDSIKRIRFDLTMIYPYYNAEGSIASGFPGKLEKRQIQERIRTIMRLLYKEKLAYTCEEV